MSEEDAWENHDRSEYVRIRSQAWCPRGGRRDVFSYPHTPLYTPADLGAWDWNYDRDAGYPGEFPYTRGVQATMYRGRLWTMLNMAGMGDAEESNKRYKYLLAMGRLGYRCL